MDEHENDDIYAKGIAGGVDAPTDLSNFEIFTASDGEAALRHVGAERTDHSAQSPSGWKTLTPGVVVPHELPRQEPSPYSDINKRLDVIERLLVRMGERLTEYDYGDDAVDDYDWELCRLRDELRKLPANRVTS